MGSNTKGALTGPAINSAKIVPDAVQVPNPPPVAPSGIQAEVLSALNAEDIRAARTIVAEEEARLQKTVHDAPARDWSDLACAKARIAMFIDDAPAAHAILVMALESSPDDRALRVLMSEIMLATGRASDARPVLKHIGKTSTPRPDTGDGPTLDDAAGTDQM